MKNDDVKTSVWIEKRITETKDNKNSNRKEANVQNIAILSKL